MRYFKEHHLPKYWYEQAGGSQLVILTDVRWNTYADSLRSYIKNWAILAAVCESHRDDEHLDETIGWYFVFFLALYLFNYNNKSEFICIAKRVIDVNIKRNTEDLLHIIQPIANAIDVMQADNTKIADAVCCWKRLESLLNTAITSKPQSEAQIVRKKFANRYGQAIPPVHLAAFSLSPTHRRGAIEPCATSADECLKAEEHIRNIFPPNFMAELWKFRSNLPPYNSQHLHTAGYLTDNE